MDFLGLYLLQLALIGKLNITYFSTVELVRNERVDLRMVAAARISLSFMPISASSTSPYVLAFCQSCMMRFFFPLRDQPLVVMWTGALKGLEQSRDSVF